jgi:multimeric flavodoxin WrbA
MRILAVNGSPRKGGNTDTLLEKALEGARALGARTVKIDLSDMDISPVREKEYSAVTDEGLSVVSDDIHVVFDQLKRADAVILGSPVFFGSLSAQLKTMIDRFQCVWLSSNIYKKDLFSAGKKGAFICVQAGSRDDFFSNASSIVKHFFATINTEYSAELFCGGLEEKNDARDRVEYLEKAFDLGRSLSKA